MCEPARGPFMSRALLCSVVLLSLGSPGCGSSSSDGPSNTAGGSNQNQAGANASGGGSSNATAGMTGTPGAGAANPSGGSGTGTAGSGTAGAGAGAGAPGSAGAAGGNAAAGSGAGGGGAVTGGTSVTQWGGDLAHTSHWVHASLTKANAAKLAFDTFAAPTPAADYAGNFAGEVAALPLYLAGASGGAGVYIVVTTQNDVYAFTEGTGALAWKHNIGPNLGKGGSICGTPTNHGIVSTPVIDPATRVIYVIGGMTDGHYEIHALSADTGMPVTSPAGWPVNGSSFKAGSVAFKHAAQSQRSALSLVNGILYVAFGGYCGDMGDYKGWVEAVDVKDPSKMGGWATMDPRQGGIWCAAGMPSDGNGVFAVTGNVAAATGMDHSNSDSEEVIRVTGLGVGNRDSKNMFFPSEWATPMNSADLDFGSGSPTIFTVPGSTPSSIMAAPAKNGRVYFLDSANLGASLGQFADMAVADTTRGSVFTSPTAYTTGTGVYTALITGSGSQCKDPVGVNNGSVMAIKMKPGSPPTPEMSWCAKIGTDGATTHRSPISTSSAGTADPIVWTMDGSKLKGFDGDTGAVVFDGGSGTCAGVHSFTSLIQANGHIVSVGDSGGKAHLCSWSVH